MLIKARILLFVVNVHKTYPNETIELSYDIIKKRKRIQNKEKEVALYVLVQKETPCRQECC